jgi:hypothetical protein
VKIGNGGTAPEVAYAAFWLKPLDHQALAVREKIPSVQSIANGDFYA